MKAKVILLLAVIFALSPTARASRGTAQWESEQHSGFRMALPGIYRFRKDIELTPKAVVLNGQLHPNDEAVRLTFSQEEPVLISYDRDGQMILTPILSAAEKGKFPEKIILSSADLNRMSMSFVGLGDEQMLAQNFSEFVETQVASRGGGAARIRSHRTIGNCKAWVNSFLVGRGLIPHRVGAVPAYTMAAGLRGLGWYEVGSSNTNLGTTCVWSGGWHGLGHTQVWDGSCWRDDKGCHSVGYPGGAYSLMGCYARGGGSGPVIASGGGRRRIRDSGETREARNTSSADVTSNGS